MEPEFFPPVQLSLESGYTQARVDRKNIVFSDEISSGAKGFLFAQDNKPSNESFSNPAYIETSSESNGFSPRIVVSHPENFNPPNRFKVLQRWEGYVVEITDGECRAVIRNMISPESPREEITFSLEEVPKPDLELVVPGAVFYWSIGYKDSIQGQRTRESMIRFRRLPLWTEKELEKAKTEAQSLGKLLGWE